MINLTPSKDYNMPYYILGIVENEIIIILLDTGSCQSFISEKRFQNLKKKEIRPVLYGTDYLVNQEATISIRLGKTFYKEIILAISDSSVYHVLLGTDFLEYFDNYVITKNYVQLFENKLEHIISRSYQQINSI